MEENFTKDIALLVVGAVVGLAPWLLDKVGIEMPKPIYRIFLAASVVLMWWALAKLGWVEKIPGLSTRMISWAHALLAGVALIFLWLAIKPTIAAQAEEVGRVKTEIRLQFVGGPKPPIAMHSDNIYVWYATWSPSAAISLADADRKQIGQSMVIPENWNLFVVFEKPTKISQVMVSFSAPNFPPYEVKQTSERSVIVNVSGSIPAGYLEIYVSP